MLLLIYGIASVLIGPGLNTAQGLLWMLLGGYVMACDIIILAAIGSASGLAGNTK